MCDDLSGTESRTGEQVCLMRGDSKADQLIAEEEEKKAPGRK